LCCHTKVHHSDVVLVPIVNRFTRRSVNFASMAAGHVIKSEFKSLAAASDDFEYRKEAFSGPFGRFAFWNDPEHGKTGCIIPHWFPTLLFAAFAALPWLPFKRFSLRTLLIATTLIAVVLGIIVWVAR
jgi:hypothetical protein